MYTILVCDDDRDIVQALNIYLTSEGYRVLTASNGLEALELVKRESVQLVLMDVMMPGMDGIQATAQIREKSNLPILFLTAKSEDTDKILGLNIGADDYITKPFNPMELMARIRSQLRRYTRLGGVPETPDALEVGPIVLDETSRSVSVDGENVTLTPLEYNILHLLMSHPGQVFTVTQIYEQAWKENAGYGSESTVPVHIRHIREKIEIDPAHPRYLKVVWGVGYKISAELK
jgi:DNA-binding response OmpR family regulator